MYVMSLKNTDISSVTELLSKGKPYVLPHHDYVYWIMKEYFPSSNYVVSTENKIIGYICALPSIDKQSYFIWQIVIDEEYRGKKVAALLVDRIIEEAKLKGFKRLDLTIDCNNMASYNLFKRTAIDHKSDLVKIGEYANGNSNEIIYSIDVCS